MIDAPLELNATPPERSPNARATTWERAAPSAEPMTPPVVASRLVAPAQAGNGAGTIGFTPVDPDDASTDRALAVPSVSPALIVPSRRNVDAAGGAAPERLAWLREVDGVGDYLLNRTSNSIGRAADCDVVLDEPTVAPHHATVLESDDGWLLMPSAPTVVEGTEVVPGESLVLADGMALSFGGVRVELFLPPLTGSVRRLVFASAARTDIGGRPTNQDSHHAGDRIVAVADGVAGRPGGAVASALVVNELLASDRGEPLEVAAERLNREVRRRSRLGDGLAGMATTLDAAVLRLDADGGWVEGVHVGDGQAIVIGSGQPEVLTRPHTLASELVAAGRLSTTEGRHHPERAALLRGIGLAESVSPDVWQRRAEAGHRYVLASDGLLAALGERALHQHLRRLRTVSPDVCADRLILEARQSGAQDNVTVVVADVVEEVVRSSGGRE